MFLELYFVSSMLWEGFGSTIAHVYAYHGQLECMQELPLAELI